MQLFRNTNFDFLRWRWHAVALSAVHQELAELIRCLDRDILRPIAQLNFGRECQYQIRPRSLVEKYAEMFGTREVPSSRFKVQSRNKEPATLNSEL